MTRKNLQDSVWSKGLDLYLTDRDTLDCYIRLVDAFKGLECDDELIIKYMREHFNVNVIMNQPDSEMFYDRYIITDV